MAKKSDDKHEKKSAADPKAAKAAPEKSGSKGGGEESKAKDGKKPDAKDAKAPDTKAPAKDKGEAPEAPAKDKGDAPEAKDAKAPAPAAAPANAKGDDGREKLLHPKEVDTAADPKTKAPPPKRAPQGDARSFRNNNEFCLIYRHQNFLVRRQGTVGTLGQWSVTSYPSMASAAHAYAQECSDLNDEGFADFRG